MAKDSEVVKEERELAKEDEDGKGGQSWQRKVRLAKEGKVGKGK